MPSCSDLEEDRDIRFLLPQGVGDTEDVERYEPGGFHPVHLRDMFDGGRYRVVHKLGAGGFSTVWLARDEKDERWVALKIIKSEHSNSVSTKNVLIQSVLRDRDTQFVAEHCHQFTFDGPNGRHLCLVLPLLGPSTSELSYCLTCRLRPWLARRLAYQATRAVADLHSYGLCHGDITTGNLVLTISDLDSYGEDDIYSLFGQPVTGALETESGLIPGPEAPRYIVKSLDFLSTSSNLLKPDLKLLDFDQCFPISSPPEKSLGTPIDFLAPEVAIGRAASPASDVWALGCTIFRLRSGEGPFSSPFEVTAPADLVSYVIHTLKKDMPLDWQESVLWDTQGRPTKDPSKGTPLNQWWDGDDRSLRDLVYNIWDEPKDRVVQTGISEPAQECHELGNQPFSSPFLDMVWNPKAIKVDNAYLSGYDDEWGTLLKALPKIPEHEAALLYDLLSKTFTYNLANRPTAREMLDHPWFHLDG